MLLRLKLSLIVFIVLCLTTLISAAQDTEQTPDIEIFRDSKDIPMIYIPEGRFTMGEDLNAALERCGKLVPEQFVSQFCSTDVFQKYNYVP